MRRPLLFLAIGAAAAGGAGWAVDPFRPGGGTPTHTAVDQPIARSANGPAPSSPDAAASEPPAAAPHADPAIDPHAEIARLLALIPEKTWPGGDGAITGRVLRHEDDAPVPGIAIDALIRGPPPGAEPKGVDSPDLLGFLREEIEQIQYARAMARRGVTDAEGRFRIEGLLPDGEYDLHVAPSEEWVVMPEETSQRVSPGDEIRFRATPFATVVVRAHDAQGAPVPTGTVRMKSPLGARSISWNARFSPDSPEVRVPIACTVLTARAQRGTDSEEVEVHLAAGERREVRFACRSDTPQLRVRILPPDPIDRMGVVVTAQPLDGAPIPDDPTETIVDDRVREDTLDERGEWVGYWWDEREPARFLIRVVRNRVLVAEREIVIGPWEQELEVSIPPRPPAELAFVRILGPDGEPVLESEFYLEAGGGSAEAGGGVTLLDSETRDLGAGRHAVILLEPIPTDPAGMPGEFYLSFHPGRLGPVRAPIRFGVTEEQTIRIRAPSQLTVRIIDYVGHELQGKLAVEVAELDSPPAYGRHGSMDPVGAATFERVQSGPQLLRLRSNLAGSSELLSQREIHITPGRNELVIAIPVLHAIRVRFPDHAVGKRCSLSSAAGGVWRLETIPEDGLVEFRHLLAGSHRIEIEGRNERMMVEVPRVADLRFEAVGAKALLVHLRSTRGQREPGWLERAGFQRGDRIIGLAPAVGAPAADLAGIRELTVAVIRAISRGKGELIVERAGEELRIPVIGGNPGIFELGGRIEPVFDGGAP